MYSQGYLLAVVVVVAYFSPKQAVICLKIEEKPGLCWACLRNLKLSVLPI